MPGVWNVRGIWVALSDPGLYTGRDHHPLALAHVPPQEENCALIGSPPEPPGENTCYRQIQQKYYSYLFNGSNLLSSLKHSFISPLTSLKVRE